MISFQQFAYRTTFCFSFCASIRFLLTRADPCVRFFIFIFLEYGSHDKALFSISWSWPEISLRMLLFVHQHVWWVPAFTWSSTSVQWVSSVWVINYTKLGVRPVFNSEIDWCRISGSALLPPPLGFSLYTTFRFRPRHSPAFFCRRHFRYVLSLPSVYHVAFCRVFKLSRCFSTKINKLIK